jgi:hypothetical protein
MKRPGVAWLLAASVGIAPDLGRADLTYISNRSADVIAQFASAGSGKVSTTNVLVSPAGLTMDSRGDLYTSDDVQRRIYRFTTGGGSSDFFWNTNLRDGFQSGGNHE